MAQAIFSLRPISTFSRWHQEITHWPQHQSQSNRNKMVFTFVQLHTNGHLYGRLKKDWNFWKRLGENYFSAPLPVSPDMALAAHWSDVRSCGQGTRTRDISQNTQQRKSPLNKFRCSELSFCCERLTPPSFQGHLTNIYIQGKIIPLNV